MRSGYPASRADRTDQLPLLYHLPIFDLEGRTVAVVSVKAESMVNYYSIAAEEQILRQYDLPRISCFDGRSGLRFKIHARMGASGLIIDDAPSAEAAGKLAIDRSKKTPLPQSIR